ncbi:hypothetical protein E2C01_072786 [Portunus trituberculatus]|uniref:Uncharacterized protein n=1 Tax=Portunus trituberculatus TaxID=210409 RepID=A0A5B7I3I7_PORTR|nr:hypothetical protein [Portunus trituberculatus]
MAAHAPLVPVIVYSHPPTTPSPTLPPPFASPPGSLHSSASWYVRQSIFTKPTPASYSVLDLCYELLECILIEAPPWF